MTAEETGPREDWRLRLAGSAAALISVALMALAVSFIDPRYSLDAAGRALLTHRPRALFAPLVYTALGVLLALGVVRFTRVRWRPYRYVVPAAFLVCGGFWEMANLLALRSNWISTDLSVTGPDGATYRAGGDGDGEYWVVRDLDARWDRTVVEIVAGDMSHSARLILPAGEPAKAPDASTFDIRIDAAGRVYVLASHELLVAYDPRGVVHPPRWIGDDDPNFRRQGMTDAEISPFALISAHATGDEAEVREVLSRIAAARDSGDRYGWAPAEAVLVAALDSPNPWIVDTARTFVREGGATLYPTASLRLPR